MRKIYLEMDEEEYNDLKKVFSKEVKIRLDPLVFAVDNMKKELVDSGMNPHDKNILINTIMKKILKFLESFIVDKKQLKGGE